MCVPFDKVSEVIDWDGRARPAVTGKNVVYDGSAVILKQKQETRARLSWMFPYWGTGEN